jgi:hypothetical protein
MLKGENKVGPSDYNEKKSGIDADNEPTKFSTLVDQVLHTGSPPRRGPKTLIKRNETRKISILSDLLNKNREEATNTTKKHYMLDTYILCGSSFA